MNKVIVSLVLMFAFVGVGCKTAGTGSDPSSPLPGLGCSAEQLVSVAFAGVISSVDGCKNQQAIQDDIQKAWGAANLCQAAAVQSQLKIVKAKKMSVKSQFPMKGIGASIMCPLAVDAVQSLIGTQVPASWQCSGNANVASALTAACEMLPF